MKLAACFFLIPALIGYVVVMAYIAAHEWNDRRTGKLGDEL